MSNIYIIKVGMSSAEDIFMEVPLGAAAQQLPQAAPPQLAGRTGGCTTITGSIRGPLQAVCTFAPLLMHDYHVI